MAETTVPDVTSQAAPIQEQTRSEERYVAPPVDIYEDDDGLMLLADMPGVDPNDLDVQVDRNVLTIRGTARHLAKGEPIYREFELTGFYRQFQLPPEIDPTQISAEMNSGVLKLKLARSERMKPRRIEVVAAEPRSSDDKERSGDSTT